MSPPGCAHAPEPEMRLMVADMQVRSFPAGVPPQVPGTLEPCRRACIWAAQCALRSAPPPHGAHIRQSASGRVGGGGAPAASHRSGRAQLRHPARPVADSPALRYPWSSRGQLIGVQCPRAVARPRPRDEAPPSLPRVLAARVPRLQRYYGALRFPAVLAVPLHCLRKTVTTPCACVHRSTQARRRLGARGVRVRPPPEPVVIEAETVGRPKFLGSPYFRLPCSVDAGRTAGTRPVQCRSVAPGM
jgi:hypothetical protein